MDASPPDPVTPTPLDATQKGAPSSCEQNDKQVWKHYLPTTSFAGGNACNKRQVNSNEYVLCYSI